MRAIKLTPHKVYLLVVLMAFVIFLLVGGDGHRVATGESLEAPSFHHLLGTDDLGMDILAQLCHGGGYSLFLGLFSAGIAVTIGSVVGIASGYYGGGLDKLLMSISDILTGMPQMILLILLGAFLGASYFSIVLVIALISWTQTARMVRARVIFIKNRNYIKYSRRIGATFPDMVLRHFLPALRELLTLSFIKIMSRGIVMEASLAYLGLGDPTSKSWGMMLNRAMSFPGIYFTPFWKWWVLAPLAALIGLVISLMAYSREFEV